MKIKNFCTGVLCALFLLAGQASAAVSTIVAFGDSLSDNGISATDNHGFQRYTNTDLLAEPVWVERLAYFYGAQLYDYAYGGATTGMDNYHSDLVGAGWSGLTWQLHGDRTDIRSTIAGLDKNTTLFTVWAGANDFLAGGSAQTAVDQLMFNLEVLAGLGAQQVLVPNLPDMGVTPSFYNSDMQGPATDFVDDFNQLFGLALQGFANGFEGTVYTLDIYGLLSGLAPGSDLWKGMFWDDGFHPSAIGHMAIAGYAKDPLVIAPVHTPVPGSGLLAVSGLVVVAALRRKAC